MLKTLRHRLILSHILPVLLIAPLMGIALISIIQTQSASLGTLAGAPGDTSALLANPQYVLAAILGLGSLLGVIIGWRLAVEMVRPLHQFSQAAAQMKGGGPPPPHATHMPAEIQPASKAAPPLGRRRQPLEQERVKRLAHTLNAWQTGTEARTAAKPNHPVELTPKVVSVWRERTLQPKSN
jgi:hypothetical protein